MKTYWVGNDRGTFDPVPSFSQSPEESEHSEPEVSSSGLHSVHAADTHGLSLDDNSEEKAHYIHVHASSDCDGHGHQSRVDMVGSVQDTEKHCRRIW
jgi:hypothetical protein